MRTHMRTSQQKSATSPKCYGRCKKNRGILHGFGLEKNPDSQLYPVLLLLDRRSTETRLCNSRIPDLVASFPPRGCTLQDLERVREIQLAKETGLELLRPGLTDMETCHGSQTPGTWPLSTTWNIYAY